MFKVLLSHTEHIPAVGKKHIPILAVFSQILVLALFELLQFCLITWLTLYPTSLIQAYWFPTALGIILILQSVLDNLELQLTNGTNNLAIVKLVDKKLGHTLIH